MAMMLFLVSLTVLVEFVVLSLAQQLLVLWMLLIFSLKSGSASMEFQRK